MRKWALKVKLIQETCYKIFLRGNLKVVNIPRLPRNRQSNTQHNHNHLYSDFQYIKGFHIQELVNSAGKHATNPI